MRALLTDAIEFAHDKDTSKINLYTLHPWFGWQKQNQKRPRQFESVILDEGIDKMLIDDMTKFLKSAEWYTSKGIPYRRGYLLYGPPGTGKTSFI